MNPCELCEGNGYYYVYRTVPVRTPQVTFYENEKITVACEKCAARNLDDIVGEWPGEETDEEINEALDETNPVTVPRPTWLELFVISGICFALGGGTALVIASILGG